MPKGYVIFTEDVTDPDGMVTYGRVARKAMVEHKAVVLAVDPSPEVIEGDWHGSQTVVLEFETVDAARSWYNSTEYQQAVGLRRAAAETNAVIVSGFEAPKA